MSLVNRQSIDKITNFEGANAAHYKEKAIIKNKNFTEMQMGKCVV